MTISAACPTSASSSLYSTDTHTWHSDLLKEHQLLLRVPRVPAGLQRNVEVTLAAKDLRVRGHGRYVHVQYIHRYIIKCNVWSMDAEYRPAYRGPRDGVSNNCKVQTCSSRATVMVRSM